MAATTKATIPSQKMVPGEPIRCDTIPISKLPAAKRKCLPAYFDYARLDHKKKSPLASKRSINI